MTTPQRNSLFFTGLGIAGLIIFIFFGSDRNFSSGTGFEEFNFDINILEQTEVQKVTELEKTVMSSRILIDNNSAIDFNLSVPPGMGARKIIQATRKTGQPYALAKIFNKAKTYQEEGSLADAHLLYFFSAREGHLESIMQMALMSDPTQFRAGISLLDQSDLVQSYKWYQKAALTGYQPAIDSIKNLRQWSLKQSKSGNSYARQLLLDLKS